MLLGTISEVARRLGVSTRTLRAWEANGKLMPTFRTQGGVRLYDMERLPAVKPRSAPAARAELARVGM